MFRREFQTDLALTCSDLACHSLALPLCQPPPTFLPPNHPPSPRPALPTLLPQPLQIDSCKVAMSCGFAAGFKRSASTYRCLLAFAVLFCSHCARVRTHYHTVLLSPSSVCTPLWSHSFYRATTGWHVCGVHQLASCVVHWDPTMGLHSNIRLSCIARVCHDGAAEALQSTPSLSQHNKFLQCNLYCGHCLYFKPVHPTVQMIAFAHQT